MGSRTDCRLFSAGTAREGTFGASVARQDGLPAALASGTSERLRVSQLDLNPINAASFGDTRLPAFRPLRGYVEKGPADAGVLPNQFRLLDDVPGHEPEQGDYDCQQNRREAGASFGSESLSCVHLVTQRFQVIGMIGHAPQ